MIDWTLKKKIQMVDLKAQHDELSSELTQAIQSVVNSSQYINGEEVIQFSSELSSFLGGAEVIPCGNGTDALQLAYMALELQPGDEVIIPSFNYVAAAEAACLLKLKPVFAEISNDHFCIDPKSVEKLINSKTKAIVAVHLFGQGCDLESLTSISNQYGLVLIEDNAQSIGAVSQQKSTFGKPLGTIGGVGITSFFPSKNLGAMGDGGAVFCSDPELADQIRMMANHGQRVRYRYEKIGINSRLDAIQAAILRIKLPWLGSFNERRLEVANRYDAWLGNHPGIRIPERNSFSNHVFHQYTIQLKDKDTRNELQAWLAEWGIQSIIYYPIPLHLQPAYK
ncbi:MAG TPA: DegT/DnrJ/EryC1/StrS family aminotransferase, partial [Catalimonadaceae bacterium]|nr:DegT/DnrJ/EryC1/StrS family aminotransferase [Catalimonadaceae bacterium]